MMIPIPIYQDSNSNGRNPKWWEFLVALLIAGLIGNFIFWVLEHNSNYKPYTGTYIQYLKDTIILIINTLKDII